MSKQVWCSLTFLMQSATVLTVSNSSDTTPIQMTILWKACERIVNLFGFYPVLSSVSLLVLDRVSQPQGVLYSTSHKIEKQFIIMYMHKFGHQCIFCCISAERLTRLRAWFWLPNVIQIEFPFFFLAGNDFLERYITEFEFYDNYVDFI